MEKYTHHINRIKNQVDNVQNRMQKYENSDAEKRLKALEMQPKAMKMTGIAIIATLLLSFIGINIWLFQ